MDLRKRLLDKIREQQFAVPNYSPVFVRRGHVDAQRIVRTPRGSPTTITGGGVNGGSTGPSTPTTTTSGGGGGGPSNSPSSGSSPTSNTQCQELVWQILDKSREQLQNLINQNEAITHKEYVVRWNTGVWPLLDVSLMLSTSFDSPSHRSQESSNDYALRREIVQLLSLADDTSPVRRYAPGSPTAAQAQQGQQGQQAAAAAAPPPSSPGDPSALLFQHYLSAAEQLGRLGSMIASGGLVEDQLIYVLRQYRAAATNFTNQIVPQVLNSEAVRVRSLEQQRHSASSGVEGNGGGQQPNGSATSASAPSSRAASPNPLDGASGGGKSPPLKMSEHLLEFRSLLDWCFALVGTLVNNTIEMLNQTFLYAETNRYFAIMQSELQGIVPTSVMGLCRFVFWVSHQPPMIMVTKTEFGCHCVLLNTYFTQTDQAQMQIVSESVAHEIQQKCFLKHSSLVSTNQELTFPSAGVLVMKKFDPFSSSSTNTNSAVNQLGLTLRRTLSSSLKRRRRSRAQPASTPGSAVSSPPPPNAPSSSSYGAGAHHNGYGTDDDHCSNGYVFTNGSTTTINDDYHPQRPPPSLHHQLHTNLLHNSFVGAQQQPQHNQEKLEISWRFDQTSKMAVAEAEQACCTDRNLTSDGSTTSSGTQANSADRQRDIYYLHCWTKMAIFGTWYNVHTLSLPFVIPTRKNQDLQLHRMLKSYSATIFWLHVAGKQDGFILDWNDYMSWGQFANALNAYFMRESKVQRGLSDFDFMLLKEKAKCSDCSSDCQGPLPPDKLAYQNIICPHLFYQSNERPLLKHSLWRAVLDLIQLFQNERTKVRELWERGVLGGLWSMDSVSKILARHAPRPVLLARISLLSGGSIVLSFFSGNNNAADGLAAIGGAPGSIGVGGGASATALPIIHTEPLDQQQLARRNLLDCLADIAESEGIEYILDSNLQPVPCVALFPADALNGGVRQPLVTVRANSDQLGCPNSHRQYTFHALKLSIVACRGMHAPYTGPNQHTNGTGSSSAGGGAHQQHPQTETRCFETELRELMQRHGYTLPKLAELWRKFNSSDDSSIS